ncbi:hypothetical protein C799_03184 [Bacteroides thetaiotaomicron dnLKV9]|uniref:Uncharacterized protein n=1 Tax=Bacteroides thetaiotaomicron dnLKV9 TaxID=1235785 RepID=R9HDP5_BACT4|nr:hypothetical protein [Bacteroides thetaiotaomicron]EOR99304.1 hypothetical protein C799_03184 [Bacteroides thetaiotaomicron dnLKV9]
MKLVDVNDKRSDTSAGIRTDNESGRKSHQQITCLWVETRTNV